jgi:hypothetical protein
MLGTETHRDRAVAADLLEPVQQRRRGVERVGQLGAAQTQGPGGDEHEGVGGIDQARLDLVALRPQHVHRIARGQEPARRGAAWLHELQPDGRAGAGDAVKHEGALDHGLAVRRRKPGDDDLAGVGVKDADARLRPRRRGHEPLVERERADRRGHVAACAREIDDALAHRDLGEGVLDVGVLAAGRADDADLGERRDAAAHAVELPPVGVGRPDRGKKDRRPVLLPRGQVAAVEDDRLRGAAAHEHRRNRPLRHRRLPCAQRRSTVRCSMS